MFRPTRFVLPAKILASRTFAISQADLLKNKIKDNKLPNRFSPEDDRARKLIKFVENKQYHKALHLVKEDGLSPDSHGWNENTVLTDCAKRGDVEGTRFSLYKLGACLTASCHCPKHRSCFHYASLGGHVNVLKELYCFADLNSINDINILDSDGYTHLEVAKDDVTRKFIIENKKNVLSCSQLSSKQILRLKAPDI